MRRISFAALVLTISLALVQTACSSFERSTQSGYGNDGTSYKVVKSSKQIAEEKRALVELGIDPDSVDVNELQSKIRTRVSLRRLEKSLDSNREKEQYYKYASLLDSDEEKVKFLELGSYEARQAYVRSNGVGSRNDIGDKQLQEMATNEDISLGMNQDWVRKSWGDPVVVEVAGNPVFKNEKWKFKRYIASPDGYKIQSRSVYFEGGKVVGWESE